MKILILLIVIVILLIAYVRYLEKTSLFYPSKEMLGTPTDLGLAYEDIFFETEKGIRLNAWWISAPKLKDPQRTRTLLFLHGNAGNISGRLGKIFLFHQMGMNIFIIDYRGYGKSDGVPTEKGMYEDAVKAYQYIISQKNIKPEQLIIYGASLGGVAAIHVASFHKAAGLILDSTFSNAVDMAKHIYPYLPSFFMNIKLDNMRKIQDVHYPKLVIHSPDDETVPFKLGKKLFEAAPEPKMFLEVIGDHNDDHFNDEGLFTGGIQKFLDKYCPL